jgi:N-acetyl sugar amidotransferase
MCLIPDTRPNGKFDEAGVCVACSYAFSRRNLNFDAKFNELREFIAPILSRPNVSEWDCIVGVSGGKDSTRQALWVREKLKLHPLLVSVAYPPRQISEIGARNLSNLNNLGFDLYVLGPGPAQSKKLVREAFFRFGNWCKATEMALFSGVPRLAHQLGVGLIFWGENPALQVGDQGTLGFSEWDGSNLMNSNTINGGDLGWFKEVVPQEELLEMYRYPSRSEIDETGIRTVFLGPAWEDWDARSNSMVSTAYGFTPRGGDPLNTGDLLGTQMVDEDWTIVNYLLKFYKLGFSRASEYASELIRQGELTREEGIAIAEEFDGACADEYVQTFCDYIEIEVAQFWDAVNSFANPILFERTDSRPQKLFTVGKGIVR